MKEQMTSARTLSIECIWRRFVNEIFPGKRGCLYFPPMARNNLNGWLINAMRFVLFAFRFTSSPKYRLDYHRWSHLKDT